MSTQIPATLEAPAARPGCGRKALVGCGVAALVLFAAVVGFFLYVRRNPAVVTDLMMKQIESHCAADVTEQDKTDLRAAYAEFRAAVKEDRVNQQAMRKIQFSLSGNRSNQVDKEQARLLAQAFREAAGKGPTAPSPSASPAAAASPPS